MLFQKTGRYDRHFLLEEIGKEGHEKISKARVLVAGCGGLGSPVIQYLAAAGVGTIGVSDFDKVSLGNLQRQTIFSEKDIGKQKTDSAERRIREINSSIKVEKHPKLIFSNARGIVKKYDVVVDCTDSFPAKYLINDACYLLGKPWIHGSALKMDGRVAVFDGKPCYRCLLPSPPKDCEKCETSGVLGPVCGIIGSIQATEAIKIIIGKGSLKGKIVVFDGNKMDFEVLSIKENPGCILCGTGKISAVNDVYEENDEMEIEPAEAKRILGEGAFFVDVREKWEHETARIEGSLLVPMRELESRISEIPKGKDVVVYCHHGARSYRATMYLRENGIRARSLAGGIEEWSRKIDRKIPRY